MGGGEYIYCNDVWVDGMFVVRVIGVVFGSFAVTFSSWTEFTCCRVRTEGTVAVN